MSKLESVALYFFGGINEFVALVCQLVVLIGPLDKNAGRFQLTHWTSGR